jgi:hypothetical protein
MSTKMLDITPTWGEIGNLFMRLALSNEARAIEAMKPEIARAMASAQALVAIEKTLTDEQNSIVAKTLAAELTKQGY